MISNETIASLKKELEEKKLTLEQELNTPEGKIAPDDADVYQNYGDGEDENAQEIATFTVNLAVEKTLEADLRNVVAALNKIDEGAYGICEKCEQEIPVERLKVLPEARFCITCAQ